MPGQPNTSLQGCRCKKHLQNYFLTAVICWATNHLNIGSVTVNFISTFVRMEIITEKAFVISFVRQVSFCCIISTLKKLVSVHKHQTNDTPSQFSSSSSSSYPSTKKSHTKFDLNIKTTDHIGEPTIGSQKITRQLHKLPIQPLRSVYRNVKCKIH